MTRSRGRFAPSPTGPLHFGSLVAAVASFCQARHSGGEWLLRMEDLDQPRCVPGAADEILRQLERLGFTWDGEITYQSRRAGAYAAALDRLQAQGRVFACACSRKEIADSALNVDDTRVNVDDTRVNVDDARVNVDGERVYPGTCRQGLPPGRAARAWRLRVDSEIIGFEDAVQGPVCQDLARVIGDFVLRRADGIHAYQLAVVVDDAEQGITEVVRGADLLDSTPRQLLLQQLLGLPTPRYAHVPVAVNAAGEKLSKQTLAPALDPQAGAADLLRALRFLGQGVPDELARAQLKEIWDWAFAHWDLGKVPGRRSQALADCA